MKGSVKQILGEPKEIIYKIFVILLSNLFGVRTFVVLATRPFLSRM